MKGLQKIKAVIFDMDGVISDTQTLCASVESELLKEHGIFLSVDEISRRYAGVISHEMFTDIFNKFNKPLSDLETIVNERKSRIDAAAQGNVRAIPGTIEFIKKLKKQGMPIAVASGSRTGFIELVLGELNLRNDFDAIASAQEVARGKPEPDVFLLAAKRLNIEPKACVVIEDGISGMIAARRAGMRCIALVRNNLHDINEYPADTIVDNLKDVQLETI